MLRFRPILPKPTTTTEGGGAVSVTTENVVVCKRRAKRKYVRVRRKTTSKSSKRLGKRETPELNDTALVTLQLMPERDEPERCMNVDFGFDFDFELTVDHPKPPCATTENVEAGKGLDQVTAAAVTESCVTVESVTVTCMGEGGLGCTDVEKLKNLETDTCPGFVSDSCYRVRWVNDAYKRMVVSEEEDREVVVWLKVKESVAWWCYSYPAFTCGVRLQYTWRNEKCTKMVPCDVWKLDCGGFAWRLDVKAALSLGL